MKKIDIDSPASLPGKRINKGDTFLFQCHSGLSCFNRCCRNLNLFLYPYDVIRLKHRLNIPSDRFLDEYVDVVMRRGNHFPDVLLKMSETEEKTCPFLTSAGCDVYSDRPDACRTFPVEQGVYYDAATRQSSLVSFFKPPEFCMGQYETQAWTIDAWEKDQDAVLYHSMTLAWSTLKQLFQNDPWGPEGAMGRKAKMAFMATYNIDRFREFVFNSTFLKRYWIKSKLLKRLKTQDAALLQFGFEWVKFFVWGMPTNQFRLK